MTDESATRRSSGFAAPLVFLVVTFAALAPIRSYDYFWHLATGRYIVEQRTIPRLDPFAIGSEPLPWINASWLFDVALFAVQQAGGDALVGFARALFIGALFGAIAAWAARRTTLLIACAVSLVAYVGAALRLGTRPETAALGLTAALIVILLEAPSRWRIAGAFLVSALWANVHASALLAPMICGAFLVGALIESRSLSSNVRTYVVSTLLSAIAMLLTPFGWSGVLAPLRLTSQVSSGAFVNSEWSWSTLRAVPLLYVALILVALIVLRSRRRNVALLIIGTAFAFLAVRYVRNVGFFFVVAAIVAAAHLPSQLGRRGRLLLVSFVLTVGIGVTASRVREGVRAGADPTYFPIESVGRLRMLDLPGNIYNADQFGGYLIWNFYPQRRVLTDGRNELYPHLIGEIAATRRDSRRWKRLLDRYDIALAVDEYRPPLEVVDARTRRATQMPASLAFYPPQEWALVAYDGVAMVFARRSRFDATRLRQIELIGERPDARGR